MTGEVYKGLPSSASINAGYQVAGNPGKGIEHMHHSRLASLGASLRSLICSHWAITVIVILAGIARISTIGHGMGFHPDERHMVMVTNDLQKNGMNPQSFAYGSLPFYLSWFSAQILGMLWPTLKTYDGLFYVGRSIACLFGMLGIIATYVLAIKLSLSRTTAITAAALLASNVFHFQLSRYFAVDIYLTTLSTWTIIAAINIVQKKSLAAYIWAAVLWGLSIGTKVSALNLGIPLGLAVLSHGWQSRQLFRPKWLIFASSIPLIAACVFLLVEPFALIDFSTFWKHTQEQIGMVQGGWRPPYVIQYENTTAWLYPLEQMARYTVGPLVFTLACIGLLFAIQRGKDPSWAPLLVWAGITFFAFGGLPVKFPRYLLPIYPLVCIFAAHTACRLTEQRFYLGKALQFVPAILIAISVFNCAAFYQIYTHTHPYEAASRWIFANVPAGSKILGVDWDDRLPLSLPGHDARQYKFEGALWELQLYHPDSDADKLGQFTAKLAMADYIVLPTPRSYGAIPRISDEYPLTTNLFQLLFKGSLGYDLVQSFKPRPELAGFTFVNDLADESLSVYDHPKVLIFKKTQRLSESEITDRLSHAYRYAPLPTREEMLLQDAPSHNVNLLSARQPALAAMLLWAATLALIALAGANWAKFLFPHSPDHAGGAARTLGLLLTSGLLWIGTSLGVANTKGSTAWIVVILVLGSGALALKLAKDKRNCTKANSFSWTPEILFWVVFFGFVLIRCFQPEIFWGEKPMDFSFLNYFIRLETLPPQDPWATGETMRYYYFGSYVMALLHKMSGVDSVFGYNLSIATIAGLSVSTAYSLLIGLNKSRLFAVLGAISIVLISNFEVINLLLWGDKKGFDLFWASTRLFKEPGITEYPLWALLFADLHAHLIALPIVLISLLFVSRLLRNETEPLSCNLTIHRIFCGALLGLLFITNTWDAISFGALTAVVLIYSSLMHARSAFRKNFFKRLLTSSSDCIRDASLVALGALPFVLLFKLHSASDLKPHFGYNHPFEFNSLDQILRHIGIWLILPAFHFLISTSNFRKSASTLSLAALLLRNALYGSLPLLLGSAAFAAKVQNIPWSILGLASILGFIGSLTAMRFSASRSERFAGIGLWVCSLIIAAAEIGFLMDHMNTIFKFYNAVWVLLATANGLLIVPAWRLCSANRASLTSRGVACLFMFTLILGLAIGFAGSAFNIYTMTSFTRTSGPRPTLNGMAYLQDSKADEFAALHWLRENVEGIPVVLEAHGPSYQNFTRVSMNTGLPTILGWSYHVEQRGTSRASARERSDAIQAIYSTTDIDIAITHLKLFAVKYVFIGEEELRLYNEGQYAQAGLQKFRERADLFKQVFQSGRVTIYQVQ